VTYVESEEPDALGLLRDGLVDLAITSAFPGDRADPHRENQGAFDAVPLFTEPVVLALPTSHPLASNDPVELAELADAAWVAGCPVCRGHLLAACESVGVVPRIEFETDNAVAVLNLVAAGLGVALLPRLALATAVVPPGATIRATSPSSDRSIRVVSLPGSRRVPAIAAVLREIVQLDGRDWGLTHV
jgi:DNA-binding transcriptional LysR family regulator